MQNHTENQMEIQTENHTEKLNIEMWEMKMEILEHCIEKKIREFFLSPGLLPSPRTTRRLTGGPGTDDAGR
jgi:hypothetical protein